MSETALISRQAAIDELIAMREHIESRMSVIGCTAYEMAIEALREPERATGKWIIDDDWNMCDIEGTLIGTKEYECDKCGYRELVFDGTVTHLNFCPNCGAYMRGEQE